jgi:carbamate kinase
VIACGGGGIPVVREGGKLKGVEAVIDKDYCSALLAHRIGADFILDLTDVDYVYLDYGKKSRKKLKRLSVAEAERHMKDGQFPPGSMGPKVGSAIRFVKAGERRSGKKVKRKVIITSIEKIEKALKGKCGTLIS